MDGRELSHGLRAAVSALVLASFLIGCAPAATPATPAPSAKSAAAPTSAAKSDTASKPTAAAEQKAAPKAAKIVFPVQSIGSSFWVLFVMQEKAFAQKENFELEIPVMLPDQSAAALVGKSVDLVNLDVETAIRAIEKGENLAIVGGVAAQALYTLVASPSIKSFDQLKGKKFAVPALEGSITVFMQRMLASKGLNKGDYDLVVAGGTPARYAALKAGGVDAAILSQPSDLQAIAEGYNKLMFSTEAIKDWMWDVAVVRRDWVKANPDNEELTMRFLRALVNACRWLNDPKNKAEAVQILVKAAKASPEQAEQTYDLYVQNKVFPQEGEVSIPGMKGVIDVTAEIGGVYQGPPPAPEKYLEMSYWEKAAGKR